MERAPLKERIGPPADWPEKDHTTHSPTRSVAHEERERGEITESERSRDRSFRDRERPRERPQREDSWPESHRRRDDVYVAGDSYQASYGRDGRDWDRDRGRERGRDPRNERDWARDGPRGRQYRESTDVWEADRARGNERYFERDRYSDSRNARERPTERGWEREDRDRHRVREDAYYRPQYSRRPDPDVRYRSPPSYGHARSPPPRSRRYSRSPPRRSPPRTERERGKARDDADAHRRRDDSADSRRIHTRRGADEPDRPSRKRSRSKSPYAHDSRAARRVRTTSRSPSPGNGQQGDRSPALSARRREEKQPERHPSPPPRSAHLRDERDMKAAPMRESAIEPRSSQSQQHLSDPAVTNSRASINTPTASSKPFPSPSPAWADEKVERVSSALRSPALPTENSTGASPAARVDIPPTVPTGPRSAVVQPPPARLPQIPVWNPDTVYGSYHFKEFERMTAARMPMYEELARKNAAMRRAAAEAEIAAIDFRSAEQRRIFAEQQKQRALET